MGDSPGETTNKRVERTIAADRCESVLQRVSKVWVSLIVLVRSNHLRDEKMLVKEKLTKLSIKRAIDGGRGWMGTTGSHQTQCNLSLFGV